MPSWIGPWEIAIVLVLALLIFGPRKLPDLGASLGKSIRGFKKGLKETEDEVKTAVAEVREPVNVNTPEAEPVRTEAVETVSSSLVAASDASAAEAPIMPASAARTEDAKEAPAAQTAKTE